MMPGPRKVQQGGGMKKNAKGIQAARLLLEWIEDSPELAKDVHPIVDALTKVIRQSVAPTTRATAGMPPLGPTLDASPTGADEGTGSAMMAGLTQAMSGGGP
jgi:hypothetical protein